MKPRKILQYFLISVVAPMLSACGTYVPDVQEFWANPGDAEIKVHLIAAQVKCELERSVNQLVRDNPTLSWLNKWGAQFTLTLTILEKSGVNPGLAIIDPVVNGTFTLGFGGTVSSDATRTSKITYFYKISELLHKDFPTNITCLPTSSANGDLFIQSDLKLRDTLNAALTPTFMESGKLGEKDAIVHQVKFQIVSSGNINPSWKLVRFSNNTGNTSLFSTTRDRTQDLLITLGPLQTTPSGERKKALATAAQNSALAAEIGQAVAAAIRNSE